MDIEVLDRVDFYLVRAQTQFDGGRAERHGVFIADLHPVGIKAGGQPEDRVLFSVARHFFAQRVCADRRLTRCQPSVKKHVYIQLKIRLSAHPALRQKRRTFIVIWNFPP